jgi:cell division protein FtsQ
MTSSVRERSRRAVGDPAGADPQRQSVAGRVIALVTVAVLAVCGVVVWFTPILGLGAVAVEGVDAAPVSDAVARQVHEAVAVPDGTPLARIDLDGVRHRVMQIDAVAAVTVTRQWPHTLALTVTERVAVATVQANGRWWLLDAAGTPFGQSPTRPADLMPVQLATPARGDRATRAVLGVLASLSPEVRDRVAGLAAATAYDVTLFVKGGGTVIWGSDTDAAAKNAVIPALLASADLGVSGAAVDVSDPTLVTVRPAGTGAAPSGGAGSSDGG